MLGVWRVRVFCRYHNDGPWQSYTCYRSAGSVKLNRGLMLMSNSFNSKETMNRTIFCITSATFSREYISIINVIVIVEITTGYLCPLSMPGLSHARNHFGNNYAIRTHRKKIACTSTKHYNLWKSSWVLDKARTSNRLWPTTTVMIIIIIVILIRYDNVKPRNQCAGDLLILI